VTVLVAIGSASTARAAEATTKTIPIVFANANKLLVAADEVIE
jgi:hypothetical protein